MVGDIPNGINNLAVRPPPNNIIRQDHIKEAKKYINEILTNIIENSTNAPDTKIDDIKYDPGTGIKDAQSVEEAKEFIYMNAKTSYAANNANYRASDDLIEDVIKNLPNIGNLIDDTFINQIKANIKLV